MYTIAAATSISKAKNYDALDTLMYCQQNNVSSVQLFLDNSLLGNDRNIDTVRDYAKEHAIALTCHAPVSLNDEIFIGTIIDSLSRILAFQDKSYVIIHFDENVDFEVALSIIETLNNRSLTVCLENFYEKTDERSVLNNICVYNALLTAAKMKGLDVVPVFDLPRLFIADITRKLNSKHMTDLILKTIAINHYKPILHLIDYTDYSQERDTWTSIGKGIMPYREIFELMKALAISLDHIVLEYEDKKMFIESIPFLEQIGF